MPRFFSVVQSAVLIGDWQRLPLVVGLRQLALFSSATPSETKNRYFCGEPEVPFPGELITLLIAGKIVVKPVSWSPLLFWPLTVIRSIFPDADLALDRLDDSANRARNPCVFEEAPKS